MAEAGQRPTLGEPKLMTPRPSAARQAEAALTPKDILMTLRRHWLMIFLTTMLGLIISGGSWFLFLRFSPSYTAKTFIRVLPPVEKDPTKIQSATVDKEIQYGNRLSLASQLTSQGMFQQLLDRDKIQQTDWFKSFGDIKADRIRKAVKKLGKKFGAYPQRDGDSIIVAMTCRDKAESALIVNEMATMFVSSQGGEKRKEVADRLSRLEEQQVRVQRDLDLADRTLDDVRRRYGFTDLEEHNFQGVTERKLSDLEFQQNEIVMNIGEIRANIATLAAQAQGPIQVQVERQVENDPVMTSLAQQLAQEESLLASSLARFGEDHRIVKQIRQFIDSIQEERLRRKEAIAEQTRQSNLKDAQDRLVSLEQRLDQLEKMREETSKQKEEMDLARAQYAKNVKIRDERRDIVNSIKEQSEKLKIILNDPETPKVQLLDLAPEPLEVSFPRWEAFLPGGAILGFLAGIGLALLVELLNMLVRTPKDIASHLHIPILGIIPDAGEDEDLEDIDLALVVREAPNSIISEAYRRLRTHLKLSVSAEKSRTILITSPGAGEGKTTVAVNLAMTLVADGKRVLLIDGNLRRPNLQRIFTAPQGQTDGEGGLSGLLSGRCELKNVIRSSGTEWLEIIESGQMPANPAEALGSIEMEKLLKQEREHYDYVIIDSPPALMVSETKILARYVDGTILVFNAASTHRGTALRAINELKQVEAGILGCVLLGAKTLKGGYFRETFRSYQEYHTIEPAKA